MSPDPLPAVTLLPLPVVLLIAVLLWMGIRRALHTLLPTAHERMPYLIVTGALLAGWLGITLTLAASGFFLGSATEALPRAAAAMLVPIALALGLYASSKTVRAIVAATPVHLLIGAQLYRVIGATFLLLLAQGVAPGAFAIPAGWGDVIVGVTAPVVAWLYAADAIQWRRLAVLWNVFGLADLVVAVAMGVLTAPGRFQQLAFDAPNALLTAFPLVLVPTILVPASMLLHIAALVRLRRMPRGAEPRVGTATPASAAG